MSNTDRYMFAGIAATVVTSWIMWIAAELNDQEKDNEEE